MTRFARAKGSKASNERVPENATDWKTMKQQMIETKMNKEDDKHRKEFEKKREENYRSFLNEQKLKSVQSNTWATFSDNENEENSPNKSKKTSSFSSEISSKKPTKNKKQKANKHLNNKNEESKSSKKAKNLSELNDESESENLPQKAKKKIKKQFEKEIDEFCKESSPNTDMQFKTLTAKLEKKLSSAKSDEAVNVSTSGSFIVEQIKADSDDEPPEELDILHVNPFQNVPKKIKKKKTKKFSIPSVNKDNNEDSFKNIQENQTPKKEKREKKQKSHLIEDKQDSTNIVNHPKQNRKRKNTDLNETKNKSNENSIGIDKKKRKKQKINKIDDLKETEGKSGENLLKNNKKKSKNKKINKKNDLNERKSNENSLDIDKKNNKKRKMNDKDNNKKRQKLDFKINNRKFEKKEYSRRKPETKEQYIYINGEKVEVVLYNGFPVKKFDADRLKILRAEMVKKGIPSSEIVHTMKLERRKAEKALSRAKKIVCFNCRKSGHLLAECPELSNSNGPIETVGTGICFKCGSTEHASFSCKVVKGAEYKFAKCFICGESGHISKQCPDNPKGLYPQGGGCRVCGDVTHLKKDCPRFQQKQEENTLTVNTLDNTLSIEDDRDIERKTKKPLQRQNKIIKF